MELLALVSCLGAMLISLLGWFFTRIVSKMDEIHADLIKLTVTHGERLTRLETKAGVT